jgi:large subunit ribosomal protein L6
MNHIQSILYRHPTKTMNTTTTTTLLRTARPLARGFATTAARTSQIGKLPLTIPSGVTLHLPTLRLPDSIPSSSASARRSITINGPLGSHVLPIASAIVLHPPPSTTSELSSGSLTLSVQDATAKSQAALWGLTRALLSNALHGVSEGYRLPLRLVGVGYRAAVEPIPESLLAIASRIPPRSSSASAAATPALEPPKERLNMKLGYAHPIYIDIPADITVTTPQPTRIVLSGTDKQRLGLFAAKIRRWRKPEPYRGKVSPRLPVRAAGIIR